MRTTSLAVHRVFPSGDRPFVRTGLSAEPRTQAHAVNSACGGGRPAAAGRVLVGLADPLHAEARAVAMARLLFGRATANSSSVAVGESLAHQRAAGLGRVPLAPGARPQLPADLQVLLVRRKQPDQNAPTTSPSSRLATAHRPAGSTKLGWASIQACRMRRMSQGTPGPGPSPASPGRHVRRPVDLQRGLGVVFFPVADEQPVRLQTECHLASVSGRRLRTRGSRMTGS